MLRQFLCRIGVLLFLECPAIHATEPSKLPGLAYFPEGDAIVCENGTRANNRPLYCHERFTLIWTGEQPSVSCRFIQMHSAIERDGVRIPLQDLAQRVARYRPGRMEWDLSDPRLPGWNGTLVLTTLADASGFTARLTVLSGCKPGDRAGWLFVPPDHGKGVEYKVSKEVNGFALDKAKNARLSNVMGRFSAPVAQWDAVEFKGTASMADKSPLEKDTFQAGGLAAWVPLVPGEALSLAVVADENDPVGQATLVRREKPLDPQGVNDAAKAFDDGMARVSAFDKQVVVDTPDPYFNAAVSASVAATFGLFVDPCFVHGGGSWRQQQPGWRTMGAAYNYGFHEQAKRSIAFWGSLQVKGDKGKKTGEYSANGCQQAGNSRFFGAGFIDYKQPPHYEFQTQFFDEAVRAWRATADPALEKTLLPMLELHLTRCLKCFDPDGDGLYESYNNTWPNDSIWFSGGGGVEQSAYVYYGRRAAADMRRRIGDMKAAAEHAAVADKIKAAIDRILWLPEKGHYASYIDQIGHQRVHEDAWIYSEHVPIEAGVSTPLQAWQAMYYTDWAMEHFPFAFGGEMRQTSNYVPGHWSIREAYPGDNFAMAMGYALAGQGDDGWNILRGTMLHSMYCDPSPMRGYGNEKGQYGHPNIVSPGGLSHPNCGIDFNDIIGSRGVISSPVPHHPAYGSVQGGSNQTRAFAPKCRTLQMASISGTPCSSSQRLFSAYRTISIWLARQ